MSTINNKAVIDKLIADDGYCGEDPRVAQIVEYTNAWGGLCYGVTWSNQPEDQQRVYEEATEYIIRPRVIWRAGEAK